MTVLRRKAASAVRRRFERAKRPPNHAKLYIDNVNDIDNIPRIIDKIFLAANPTIITETQKNRQIRPQSENIDYIRTY
jgi:hypothetical protein